MLFNSYIFIFIFLPLSLAGWYGLNHLKAYKIAQGYLIGMSLWFYAYFNISYLWIIAISCLFNYGLSTALSLGNSDGKRKICLLIGCVGNLGMLGYFKYYNFFIENLNAAFHADFHMKRILLPLGISFFTFQQLSYLIDRCRGEKGRDSLLDYLSFVTFFPSLISGPIVLHAQTIPQFQDFSRRLLDTERIGKGVMQFTLGLSKKVLLADTLALAVNYGYANIASLDTLSGVAVAVFYTWELYFDFSGYSDMAIGIGKMFGIEIPRNFISPYKAESIKDFWRRWHITLSSFLQTYIYFPLGGSRKGKVRTIVNTLITFLLSGLWHGANWTFIFWGFLHGIGVAADSLSKGRIKNRCLKRAVTFAYVCMAFVFFRSDTMTDGFSLMARIFSFSYNGSLGAVAAAMEPTEIYIVTKALSMMAPDLVGYAQIAVLIAFSVIIVFILAGRTVETIVNRDRISGKFTYGLAILFVWSLISLSGVKTFLYFNF